MQLTAHTSGGEYCTRTNGGSINELEHIVSVMIRRRSCSVCLMKLGFLEGINDGEALAILHMRNHLFRELGC